MTLRAPSDTKQQLRDASLADPQVGAPGGGRSGGGDRTTGSISSDERNALKAHGFTDAQITAKYGPP